MNKNKFIKRVTQEVDFNSGELFDFSATLIDKTANTYKNSFGCSASIEFLNPDESFRKIIGNDRRNSVEGVYTFKNV